MTAMAHASVPSPCIKVCRLVELPGGGQLCAGCLRTPEEIMRWPQAGNTERREVLRRIALRRG